MLIWIVLAAATGFGAGIVLLKFYEKKIKLFFLEMDTCMDQMMNRNKQIVFPEVQNVESVMARFQNKLQRVYALILDSEERVKHENKLLQELVSDISHQVKTPLTNIKMSLAILAEQCAAEENKQEFIESAENQTEKLEFLLQTLIKVSRLETGVFQMQPRAASVYQVLAESLGTVMPQAEKKRIEFRIDCPEDLMAEFDPKWTPEVFANILDNAVKYSEADGIVEITAEKWECYTRVMIRDYGIGIPEEIQGNIFSRFYRAEEVHEQEGAGLGLYLAREIMQRQGGYITVSSRIGEGAEFSIFLSN